MGIGDQLNKVFAPLQQFWKKQTKKMKIIIGTVGIGIFVLAVVGVLMLNYNPMVVVYKDLDPTETDLIFAKIEEMGIPAKRDAGGAILVSGDQADMVVMKLALEGYPKTGYNYNMFTDNVDFMTTEFEKKALYQMMLQENLAKQISTIQVIRSALVTLNIPEQNDFVIKENIQQPTATVVLTTVPSNELTNAQIKAIERLIITNVPGMKLENISITDDTGKSLSSQQNTENDINQQRLQLQREIENAMRSKVMNLLVPMYGASNASVSATVLLDFDKIKSEDQTFTPSYDNSGMIIHEDNSSASQGSDTAEGIPGAENNAEVPGYPNLDGTGSSGISDNSSSVDYAVNNFVKQFEKDGYYIKEASIGVAINKERLTDQESEQLIELVSKSSGITDKNVSVYGTPFIKPEPIVEDNTAQIIAFAAAGLIAVITMLILMGAWAKAQKKKKQQKIQLEMERKQAEQTMAWLAQGLGPDGKPLPVDDVPQLELVETKEQVLKKEIKEFATNNPEIAAQLLRTWIGDENDG